MQQLCVSDKLGVLLYESRMRQMSDEAPRSRKWGRHQCWGCACPVRTSAPDKCTIFPETPAMAPSTIMIVIACFVKCCAKYSPSALCLLPYMCRTAVDTRVRSFGPRQRRARRNRHRVLAGLRNIRPVSQLQSSEELLYCLLVLPPSSSSPA